MTQQIYNNLDIKRHEIRLLELFPGSSEETVTATLSTVSLDASPPPRYEALSYVWGDPTIRREIQISSPGFAMSFTIGVSLEEALIRMRFPDRNRTLWVDAICINQEDIEERESQVSIMGRIYSESAQVLVWLGLEEPSDEAALSLINAAAGGEEIFLEDCDWDVTRSSETVVRKCNSVIQQVTSIFKRPWWSRSWTLQEIVLAPLVLFYLGRFAVGWNQFVAANLQIQREAMRTSYSLCLDCTKSPFAIGNAIRSLAFYRKCIEEDRMVDLLDLVVSHRERAATDPRDKVFAFMGMANYNAGDVRPDYMSSVAKVYTHFTIGEMSARRNLAVLGLAELDNRRIPDLPSWSADWSGTSRRPEIQEVSKMTFYEHYNACGGQEFAGSIFHERSKMLLALDGVQIGVVSEVGDLHSAPGPGLDYSVLQQWHKISQIDSNGDLPYPYSNYTVKEAFWRTMISDIMTETVDGLSKCHRPVLQQYKDYVWKALSRSRTFSASDWGFLSEATDDNYCEYPSVAAAVSVLMITLTERRFFISDEGLFGIAAHNVIEGDSIWIVKGGKLPLVLRKVTANEGKRSNGESQV
jgi:hypothetical protein